MNRFCYILLLSGLFTIAGCQKNVPIEELSSEAVTVSFFLDMPLATKASSEEVNADIVYWAGFDSDGAPIEDLQGQLAISSLSTSFDVTLVKNHSYKFIFWAQNSSCDAYILDKFATEGKVSVDYTGLANDALRDAFFGQDNNVIINQQNKPITVELKRPLAQINYLAKDYTYIEEISAHTSLKSALRVSGIPSVLNCFDGSVEGSADVYFSAAEVCSDPAYIQMDGVTYGWYAMNYLLAAEYTELNNVEVIFTHDLSDKPVSIVTHNVPFRRNFKTNIIGSFMTEGTPINVVIMNGFDEPDLEPQNN